MNFANNILLIFKRVKFFWQPASKTDRQMDRPLLPANILKLLSVREAESLRRLCSRDHSCQINTWSNNKIKPVQMRNWLVEPIDMFPLKQVAWIYHRSGGAWSHLEPVSQRARSHVSVCTWWNSVCVCVRECVDGQLATPWAPWLQSIRDPYWQLLCQMGFSWRLQPLSVTRSHVFIFVVDGACVRAVCNKAVCVCLSVLHCVLECVCASGGLEPRCKENMFLCHKGLVETWLRSPWKAAEEGGRRVAGSSDGGSGWFHTTALLIPTWTLVEQS